MRALAKDRDERWQSAREMQAALEEFVRSERSPSAPSRSRSSCRACSRTSSRARRRRCSQGKQLADIIALEGGADSVSGIDVRAPPSSTGVAARTLTQEKAQRGRGGWIGIAAGLGVVAIATAGVLWAKRPAGDGQARTVAAAASPAASTGGVAAVDPAVMAAGHRIAARASAPEPAPSAIVTAPPGSRRLRRRWSAGPCAGRSPDHGPPAPAAPAPGGTGKLNVAARGGWCNVTIDGAGHGPTPVAGVVVSAGTHTVTCTPESGHAVTTTVRVEADGTARYSFTLSQ